MSVENIKDYDEYYEQIKNTINDFSEQKDIQRFVEHMTVIGHSNGKNNDREVNVAKVCHDLDEFCSKLTGENYHKNGKKVSFYSQLRIPCSLSIESKITNDSEPDTTIDVFYIGNAF